MTTQITGHIIEVSSTVMLLQNCLQLWWIAWNHCLRQLCQLLL